MFEKESKEYAIGLTYPKFQYNKIANIVLRDVEGGFQKGAEYGYNKCFEQIRKIVNEHTRLDCIIPELLRLQESE